MISKLNKKSDNSIFKQIIDLIPSSILNKSIKKYKTDKHCSKCFTLYQLVSMLFEQLNWCLSLRKIAIDQSLEFLSDIGLAQSPAKSSMSDGNAKRNYRVYEDFYYGLCGHFKEHLKERKEYSTIKVIEGNPIKIVDTTIMGVCLKLFPWAEYRTVKVGIKAHVSLDEASMIPGYQYSQCQVE